MRSVLSAVFVNIVHVLKVECMQNGDRLLF